MATGQRLGIARGLEAIAALAVVQADDPTAVRLEGASDVLRETVGPVRAALAQGRLDALLSSAHQRLGPTRTASLRAEGRRLSTHEAIRYALSTAVASSQPPEPANGNSKSAAATLVPMSVLTVREQQVAMLITRGLSNRAIAAELVISPATAARHVANILGKLGLSSRAQVAAWTADGRSAADFRDPEMPRPGN
jgi:DNA-binding NarL/FixJ family response regulator